MIDDSNVRKAMIQAATDFLTGNASIETAAGTVNGLPTLAAENIAWENRRFEAEGKPLWAAVFYLPNVPDSRTIGRGGIDQINGILQIDLNVPPDTGEAVHEAWNEKARLFFVAGRGFKAGGHSVLAISSGISQGRITENFYRKSISIGFKSDLKRPNLT